MAARSRRKKPEDLKVTPEQHAHLMRIGTQAGQPSRNPKGKPPIPELLKQRAADMSEDALDQIYDMMKTSSNEMVRFRCGEYILSLNVSKAAQEQKIDMSVTHSFGDLLARINAERNIIDASPSDIQVITDESEKPRH
jgi:hypothetical protein